MPKGSERRLRRAATLRLTLQSDGEVVVHSEGRDIHCGPQALAILDAFSSERSVSEVLESLGSTVRGPAEWVQLAATIQRLAEAGVLVADGAQAAPNVPAGWDSPSRHISMLDDDVRTTAYLRAIEATVKATDTVVDLGTGTGVLAVAAAKAGARHVYAIEASGIADGAAAVIHANGLSDRVTLVRGWSTRVSLPERGTLLVSEIIGSDPLDEGVVPFVRDARTRLLDPSARVLPTRLQVLAYPASVDDAFLSRNAFGLSSTEGWTRQYGIDFTPLAGLHRGGRMLVASNRVREWAELARPLRLHDIDFSADTIEDDVEIRGTVHTTGTATALVMFFRLELCEGVSLSTEPATSTERTSWRNAVWFNPAGPRLSAGTTFALTYRRVGQHRDLALRLDADEA